jgi:cyclic-di-AMP phosphodiesterase PgpH
MSSEAGRRVVAGLVVLASASCVVAIVAVGAAIYLAVRLGWTSAPSVEHVVWGMLAAVLVLGIAFVLLPAFGLLSGLGDNVHLMEMCDPGAPLLHDLMEIAPGTYNHSIMAGSLAETAAHEIGADALLARVGAYYHDIGKLARPQFFAENQLGLRNPHDGAAPEQSAFIITAHVREGAQMAERERLPRKVIDIIEQHHGTSLVSFFYRKATACGLEIDEAPFRYEGKVPQSREAALVMLADAAEAAGRALADCGPAQIEEAVRRVVEAKRADGQLDESGMSDADVDETIAVYAKMLSGQRHSRVAYPDAPERM